MTSTTIVSRPLDLDREPEDLDLDHDIDHDLDREPDDLDFDHIDQHHDSEPDLFDREPDDLDFDHIDLGCFVNYRTPIYNPRRRARVFWSRFQKRPTRAGEGKAPSSWSETTNTD